MPKIRFDGHVFPRVIQVTVKDNPTINWFDAERQQNILLNISVQNGLVSVECEIDKYDDADLTRIFMRAFDLARATVDLVAFNSGWGLTVLFETVTSPTGITTPLAPTEPSVAALCKSFQMAPAADIASNEYDKVLRIVCSDWRIAHTLRRLIETITLPHESAVNCARSIESLRNIIAGENIPRGQAWGKMRKVLNVSEAYLRTITDVSTGPRHGDHAHIPGDITREITQRSWVIMDRFFEYKKRNDHPLSLAEFPLLTV